MLGSVPLLDGIPRSVLDQARMTARAAASGARYEPRFFTPHEWDTVRLLADMVIPPDDRSVGAVGAGVPEFMDFVMTEWPERQTPMRGGLAWLDRECRTRWGKPFRECAESDRGAMLDLIAWPARAGAPVGQGVEFFNRFRDLVAGGFWSSQVGVEDLGYAGNKSVREWSGCPDKVIRKVGG
jgi:hypothetical protein